MSVTVTVETRGIDDILRFLPEEADALVRGVALGIEGDAKVAAPVDTGYLRSSIQMKDAKRGDFEAEVAVGANYGVHVEFGTHKQRAQPYLVPATQKGKRRMERGLKALATRLEGAGR